MSKVLRGVREADSRTVVVAFFGAGRRRREQIGEDGRLQGKKTAVYAERSLARDEDDVPVRNPELFAPLESIDPVL